MSVGQIILISDWLLRTWARRSTALHTGGELTKPDLPICISSSYDRSWSHVRMREGHPEKDYLFYYSMKMISQKNLCRFALILYPTVRIRLSTIFICRWDKYPELDLNMRHDRKTETWCQNTPCHPDKKSSMSDLFCISSLTTPATCFLTFLLGPSPQWRARTWKMIG